MRSLWSGGIVAAVFCASICAAQSAVRQFVGSVTAFKSETAEIEIKPDGAAPMLVKMSAESVVQKVEPGARDLKNAQPASVTDLILGDRVLVALEPGTADVRRLVVMPKSDIAKRDEADQQDWIKRGVAGVVSAIKGNQIMLAVKNPPADTVMTVLVDEKTAFRRYAPDSVAFADAKPSSLAEIRAGDQLRVRGSKDESGKVVTAENVVFGTFQTKVGTIAAIDAGAHTIQLKEMSTNKLLTVRVTSQSRLKKMPELAGMAPKGGSFPPGGAPPPAMSAGFGARGGGPPDLGQMLEMMPPTTMEQLKAGETVVVSSTQGTKADALTAIMLVANADMIIRMASAQGRGRGANPNGGVGMNGLNGVSSLGLGGFELPAMIP